MQFYGGLYKKSKHGRIEYLLNTLVFYLSEMKNKQRIKCEIYEEMREGHQDQNTLRMNQSVSNHIQSGRYDGWYHTYSMNGTLSEKYSLIHCHVRF